LEELRVILDKSLEARLEEPESATESNKMDDLDAAFSVELIGKLPKVVDRASLLPNMSLDVRPDMNVKKYFDEAHRCYLYGFPVACAVLCRAIIESSLAEVFDPDRTLRTYLKGQGDVSYIDELAKAAKTRGLLRGTGPDWVIRIRNAGNDAIHEYPKFEREWLGNGGSNVGDIIDNMRKILLDIYRLPS
jgi:hypothetical protein